jgi:serine/threonine-protein kinase
MTAEWSRLVEVFDLVAALPEAERERALEKLSAGDDALRAEVRRLLAADLRTTTSVDRPAIEALTGADAAGSGASRVGDRVGAYRLTEEIGRGGMGVVYRAERADALYHKTVAIKLLGPLADSEVLERFGREREILAALVHPNIARLLDGGVTDEGVPYLVMEHVEGRPIDRYCAEESLDLEARLALFIALSDGVQFAHRNLVVHRDLKPSNILVTGDGVPVLLDFGISKLLEADGASPTLTMHHLMTPAYASPEQVAGRPITTASDVYSLGVVLYESLTGRMPYAVEGRPLTEVAAAIAEAEPPRPSLVAPAAFAPKLRGDLDTIVLRALAKEPARRYGSAEGLADDLRRHLDGRPVAARPDTVRYRVSKFVRRHRIGVGAAALVLLALIGGAAGTAWQARVAAGERDRATLEASRAERMNEFLIDMLSAPDPRVQGRDVRVADVLDRAAARVDPSLADQPALAAEMHGTLSRTYLGLGLLEEAVREARAALERARGVPGDSRRDVAAALRRLGTALSEAGEYPEAEARHREALALFTALDQPLDRAGSMNQLAVVLNRVDRTEEAERLYRDALRIFEAHPERDEHEYAETINNLGVVLGNRGEFTEAEGLHRRALEIMFAMFGPDHPEVAYMQTNLAGVLDLQGRYDEAEPLYRAALATRERLLGEDHALTIMGAASFSNLLWLKGEPEEAAEVGRLAVERAERGLPDDHPLTAYAHLVFGQALVDLDRPHEAEAALREALRIRIATLGADHWLVANTRVVLGTALIGEGLYAEAEREMLPAYEKLLAELGPEHDRTRSARAGLADLYRAWGRPEDAARFGG